MKKSIQKKNTGPNSKKGNLAPKESKLAPKESKKEEADEKPQDYGGLPNRDLKKNLGCG